MRLSLEFLLSRREMKRKCVISVRFLFIYLFIYDGEDDDPGFNFYAGRERRVKLIRIVVNVNLE